MRCLAVLLLLAGCATAYTQIDYSRAPPADWPKLPEDVTYLSPQEVYAKCASAPNADSSLVACSFAQFDLGYCSIYLPKGHRDLPQMLAHERGHCAGYDHPGETSVRDSWAKYKARR